MSDERRMIYMQKLDFYSSDIEKVLKIEFNYGSMMRTFKNMNYDNEVLICHGDDIVLSNGYTVESTNHLRHWRRLGK